MELKRFVIVAGGYPTTDNPVYAFIKPLVHEIANHGIECTVIAPQSYSNRIKGKKLRDKEWIDYTVQGNAIKIIQPKFISMSNMRFFGCMASIFFRGRAIHNALSKIEKPDVVYAHFWDFGIAASKYAKKNNIPVIVASGESTIRVFEYYKKAHIDKMLNAITGVIFVSTKNLEESNSLGLLRHNPLKTVIPNAINPNVFYKEDKYLAREKLGFEKDDFLVAFVGTFNNRKGVNRVIEAVDRIKKAKLILIGSGEETIDSDQVVFKGRVPHNEIRTYLNAADCFVLPTLAEGCCNSIIEAMACGLPIISSDRNFNYDILDSTNALLIEPRRIDEIANAIECLINNSQLRIQLGKQAYLTSKSHTISKRADAVIEFIKQVKR